MLRRPSSMDMASWTIFSLLDKEFAAQIRLACVFGNLGNEALIVTKDDEVCPPDIKLLSNKKGCSLSAPTALAALVWGTCTPRLRQSR